MRTIAIFSTLMSVILLTACGQSGALQLASDPDHDQRAKYLLYPNPLQKQVKPVETSNAPQSQQQATE